MDGEFTQGITWARLGRGCALQANADFLRAWILAALQYILGVIAH
jgi:hypothetical protein